MGGIRDTLTFRRDSAHSRRTSARAGLVSLVFALAFSVIGLRLVDIGFTPGGTGHAGNRNAQSTAVSRPDIVDRKGRILATDIQTGSLFADPSRIVDLDTTVEQLAAILASVNAPALRKRLAGGGKFLWIARGLTPRQQARIYELGLPGIDFVKEPHRVYPAGVTASHILGHVDIDNRGLAGIERYIDKISGPVSIDAKAGEKRPPVRLAMDMSVQHAVREELAGAMARYRAKAAVGIVLDVHTGEIVALSSLPDYDPNQRAQALEKKRYNRAISGVFEMGSVFKMFTVAGALDMGVTAMDKGYDASQPIKAASFTINDFHGKRRWLTTPEIFIYSSNIGAAKMALDMGIERHKAFLGKLGLLDRLETQTGPTAAPIVPKKWRRLNTMTIAYGHGLSVTPLHVASAAAALVNGGYKVTPTYLARSREEARVSFDRVLKLQTSDLMRYLFRLNVQQGSGKRADTAGYRVGGKTGTAEKVVNGRYSRSKRLNTFLGVFPMDAPQYLVLVVLDEPEGVKQTGGRTTAGVNAAPTVGRIIERIGPMLSVTPVIDTRGDKSAKPVPVSY